MHAVVSVSLILFAYLASFAVVQSRDLNPGKITMDILYKEDSYRIMDACFEVYKDKGSGFVEPVYQECLAIEFGLQEISFAEQVELSLTYKDRALKQIYKPDFVCFGKIIVEIKAVSKLADEHRAQVHNYLTATGHQLGLLVNFGHHPQVEWERIVRQRVK